MTFSLLSSSTLLKPPYHLRRRPTRNTYLTITQTYLQNNTDHSRILLLHCSLSGSALLEPPASTAVLDHICT